ncbi:hypothetical protein NQ317_016682 [Molorchus minor]|uniref:Cation efflux protein transmembrane domain-containing protein n=1 Tax=Molorchus minor TaxID=1323400 RepID=A0ABQ9IWU1_9CUCU|nr:hypothetical protein NQ317_016682 [Molorchus minor]
MAMKEWFRKMQPFQLYIILVLTTAFFVTELIVSHLTHSLTLLMDSYHMLCNILALAGSIITIKNDQKGDISSADARNLKNAPSIQSSIGEELTTCPDQQKVQSSPTRDRKEKKLKNTFGWARIDVIVMLICCVFLASLCFSIFVEALQTLIHINHHHAMHHPISVLCIVLFSRMSEAGGSRACINSKMFSFNLPQSSEAALDVGRIIDNWTGFVELYRFLQIQLLKFRECYEVLRKMEGESRTTELRSHWDPCTSSLDLPTYVGQPISSSRRVQVGLSRLPVYTLYMSVYYIHSSDNFVADNIHSQYSHSFVLGIDRYLIPGRFFVEVAQELSSRLTAYCVILKLNEFVLGFPLSILVLEALGLGATGILLNGVCYLLIGGYTSHQGSFLYVTEGGDVILNKVVVNESVRGGERSLSRIKHIHSTIFPPKKRQGLWEMTRDINGNILVIICALIIFFTDTEVAKYVDPVMSLISVIMIMILSYPYTQFWRGTEGSVAQLVYNKIMEEVKEFFVDNGITQVTIQPEFFTKNASSENLNLKVPPKCLMACQGEGCKQSHCCPDYEMASKTLLPDKQTPILISVKILDSDAAPSSSYSISNCSTTSSDQNETTKLKNQINTSLNDIAIQKRNHNQRNSRNI